MNRKRLFFGLVGYLGFIHFTFSLLMTTYTGYTINIYSVIPTWGWTGFLIALISGTLLIYTGIRKRSRRALGRGAVLIIITFGVFWCLAQFLGLRFWSPARGDLLQHYGFARKIVETGSLPKGDLYPPLHVLLAMLRELTGLSYGSIGSLLSFTYYGLFVVGIAVTVQRIASSRIALYTLIAAIPLFYQRFVHNLTPWVMFIALVSLTFIFLDELHIPRRKNQRAWITGGTILFSLSISLGHPMSGIIGLATIFVVVSSLDAGEWLLSEPSRFSVIRLSFLLPLIVTYPIWYLSQTTFRRFLTTIVGSIFDSAPSAGARVTSRALTSGYTPQQLFARYLVVKWGTALLLIGVGGVVATVITYRVFYNRASANEFALLTLYIAGLMLATMLVAGNFITNATGVYRINQLTLVASVLLIGAGLWWTAEQKSGDWMHTLHYLLLVVILIGVVTTPFTVYSTSEHINEKEFSGVDYYLERANWQTPVYEHRISSVLSQYLRGTHKDPTWEDGVFKTGSQLPKHLGYDENSTIVETIERNEFYLVTKSRDVMWYKTEPTNRYPYINYYSRSDLIRLGQDPTVNRVYTNGGFTIWQA